MSPTITCGIATPNSVEFSWTPLSGATDYNISYSINGGASVTDNGFVGTLYPVNGLNANDVVDITISVNGSDCYTSSSSYQWQESNDGGITYTNIVEGGIYSGTNTTTLSISDNTGLNSNTYQVIINEINGLCPTTSSSVLLVTTAVETPNISCGIVTLNAVEFNWLALTGVTDYNISYTINGAGNNKGADADQF